MLSMIVIVHVVFSSVIRRDLNGFLVIKCYLPPLNSPVNIHVSAPRIYFMMFDVVALIISIHYQINMERNSVL